MTVASGPMDDHSGDSGEVEVTAILEPATDTRRRSFLVADVALADLTTANREAGTERIRARDGELLLRLVEQTAFGPTVLLQDSGRGGPVTEDDAVVIETATAVFRAWDNAQGGGLRRKAVIGQLADTTALLDGPFASNQAARRCYSAVADLAQLAGWMTWDLQLHATAQNYYLLGLALARDAGDRSQVARMMYCLSRQMIDLGRPVDALDLAAAGSYAIRRQTPPKATALLLVAQARAHACLGAEKECRASLSAAQDSFTGNAPDREWCSFFDGAEFAGLTGVTLRDLALAAPESATRIATEARSWTEKAARGRSAAFLRSKILDTDGVAVTSLLAGEPDRAAVATADALTLTSRLRSPRTIRRVTDTIAMGARAFPHAAPWDDLADQAQALPGSAPVASPS
ncbi:MAG TPA: hypothetical protein VFX16_06155 [Pseudonocardiaceae bacterium]|nr:hypothetical protein [Pseudonocardiaceae bacterium]